MYLTNKFDLCDVKQVVLYIVIFFFILQGLGGMCMQWFGQLHHGHCHLTKQCVLDQSWGNLSIYLSLLLILSKIISIKTTLLFSNQRNDLLLYEGMAVLLMSVFISCLFTSCVWYFYKTNVLNLFIASITWV